MRARYRLLIQQIGHIRSSLDWASAAQDQSIEVNFFDPAQQASSIVNYARYGMLGLREFEARLCSALGFTNNHCELLAASSGMAAYQIFEAFLLREVLRPGDKIAYAPYVLLRDA